MTNRLARNATPRTLWEAPAVVVHNLAFRRRAQVETNDGRVRRFAPPVLVLAALLVAASCTQVPPLNFSVPNVGLATERLDAELRSVTVTIARPDEQTGDVDAHLVETAGQGIGTGGAVAAIWKEALVDALNRSLFFRDDGAKRVNLAVKILKLDAPGFGAEMETETGARYEIIDRANGDIIFVSDIAAKGVVPADYDFLGATRARESINRSVQNNISLFLQQLETVDIDKPMFPAGTEPPGAE